MPDFSGYEYCQKWYFWTQTTSIVVMISFEHKHSQTDVSGFGRGNPDVNQHCFMILMFVHMYPTIELADIFGLQWSWNDIFGLLENFSKWSPLCVCAVCRSGVCFFICLFVINSKIGIHAMFYFAAIENAFSVGVSNTRHRMKALADSAGLKEEI